MLSDLKPILVEWHERWLAQHPEDLTIQPSPGRSNAYAGNSDITHRQDAQLEYTRAQKDEENRAGQTVAVSKEEKSEEVRINTLARKDCADDCIFVCCLMI